MGIIGAQVSGEEIMKPSCRGTALPGSQVRIDWVKAGHTGVVIESKRGNEAAFAVLDKDHYSPFEDKRAPLTPGASETRYYRLRYLDKDEQVGEWSDVLMVQTIP